MAKKTLLSENQISNFMKLANINKDKINNFRNKVLKEEFTGMAGTGGMEEDEPSADEMETDLAVSADEEMPDMEPEVPDSGEIETESEQLMSMIKDAVKAALAEAGVGESEEMETAEFDMEEPEMDLDMDDSEEEEEVEEEEVEEEEEEEELQESKYMRTRTARNLRGGDAKRLKESVVFDNVDLVTDNEIVNEVLKRVIRRIV